MMTTKISKSAKIAILIAAANIATIGVWLWFFEEINKEKHSVLSVRTEIEEVGAKIGNLKELEDILTAVEGGAKKVEGAFIGENTLVSFVEEVEHIAGLAGVNLEMSGASLPAGERDLGPSFSFNISGSFDEVYRFIALLESSPRQILFEDLRIYKVEATEKEPAYWKMQAKIRVISYIF